jgi:hypothetical protein
VGTTALGGGGHGGDRDPRGMGRLRYQGELHLRRHCTQDARQSARGGVSAGFLPGLTLRRGNQEERSSACRFWRPKAMPVPEEITGQRRARTPPVVATIPLRAAVGGEEPVPESGTGRRPCRLPCQLPRADLADHAISLCPRSHRQPYSPPRSGQVGSSAGAGPGLARMRLQRTRGPGLRRRPNGICRR